MISKKLLAGAMVFAAGLFQMSAATTMRLSADGGVTWTNIIDNGPADSDPTLGFISYQGTVGNWVVTVASGIGQPISGSPVTPVMDVGTLDLSTDPELLVVQLSDTGFVPFNNETFVAHFLATTTGTVLYNSYRDTGNVLFGTATSSPTASLLMSQGPFTGGTFIASNSVVVANGGNSPYSLTLETVVVHTVGGQTSSDATLFALPPPTCTGQIGDFIWNDLDGDGCQGANEPGIPGVKVDLFSGCGATKSASPIQSTVTDSNGKYLFTGLCAGDYTVHITTPNGFTHTVAHQGCGGTPGDAHNPNDSNCECTGADDCDVCVTLPTDNTVDLTIDCGYVGSQPCLTFVKTADSDTATAGGQMGYTYALTNCGSTTFTNVAIIDDAGTPNFFGDDFTVASGITLAPGQGTSFHVTVTLPMVECASNAAPGTTAGLLLTQILPSGDIKVTYRQSRNLNDNVYGTPAPADGWSQHKFSDLTGSDQCEFKFTDSTGKVVLDFDCDYISQTTSNALHPSGYASLGATGGDGKMLTGASSNVLFSTSTLADNLNSGLNGGFPSPFTVNSPAPESSFPNWDYVDGYTVIVSKNAFGAAGFGGVTVPEQHNSPAKTGNNQVFPMPCGGCITNIATVVVVTNGNMIAATLGSDDAVVCIGSTTPPPPACILTPGAFKIDKKTIQIPIKNAGTADVLLSEIDLTWNQAVNGKLVKVSLNGDFFTTTAGNGVSSPAAINSGFVADPNKRTIAKGQTKTLVLTFENNASTTVSSYSGTANFGASCQVVIPPAAPAGPAGPPPPGGGPPPPPPH